MDQVTWRIAYDPPDLDQIAENTRSYNVFRFTTLSEWIETADDAGRVGFSDVLSVCQFAAQKFDVVEGSKGNIACCPRHVCFSNRPFEVKRFQTIRRCGVDVTHGLVLLFGIGTKAVPSWDSRTRWNNLFRGLAVID